MYTPLFAGMMDKGLLRKDDPAILAFAYIAPISVLIHLCDREPDKTQEAMEQVDPLHSDIVEFFSNHHPDETLYKEPDTEKPHAKNPGKI